ncbi:unnamed protein product, partial [marine sediment metagenome]
KETIVNKPLGDIAFPKPCVVAAIIRAGGIIMPSAGELIKQDDHIYLVASREHMDELGERFAQPQRPAKSVVILGGGRVGFLVAEGLQRRGVLVKVVEGNINRCQEIAAKLEGAAVVQGDGTDRDFLIEQGVPSADAFVATTESDELNILCGLLAKNLGVSRSLILVNKLGYIPLAEAVGVVNGFNDAANAIATSIGSRALSPRKAIIIAVIANMAGAATGLAVARTIGNEILVSELIPSAPPTAVW